MVAQKVIVVGTSAGGVDSLARFVEGAEMSAGEVTNVEVTRQREGGKDNPQSP